MTTASVRLFDPDNPDGEHGGSQSRPAEARAGPLTVRAVVEAYLSNVRNKIAVRTFEDREHSLECFCSAHGDLAVTDSKPFHLRLWVDAQEQYKSDWTRKRVIGTVQTCFTWAAKLGLIDRNPFWGVSNRCGKRGRPLTDGEFHALLSLTSPLFRRVLTFLRYTGARPGEMAVARWTDLKIDHEKGMGWIVLQEHKSIRTQRDPKPRIIALHPVIVRLLIWLRRKATAESIFVNARGNSWQRSALSLRICRIRKKAKLPKDAKLYGTRHLFATAAIMNGVDLKTLSELLGHSTTRMSEHYLHLAGQHQHLADAAKMAMGHSKPSPRSSQTLR